MKDIYKKGKRKKRGEGQKGERRTERGENKREQGTRTKRKLDQRGRKEGPRVGEKERWEEEL